MGFSIFARIMSAGSMGRERVYSRRCRRRGVVSSAREKNSHIYNRAIKIYELYTFMCSAISGLYTYCLRLILRSVNGSSSICAWRTCRVRAVTLTATALHILQEHYIKGP